MEKDRLLELAGVITESEIKNTPMAKMNGKDYTVYTDDPKRVVIGKHGAEVAEATIRNGKVVDVKIDDPSAVIEALMAFARKVK